MSEHEWLDDVTPIGVSQDSLAIQNMWMGKRIAETMGYDLSNPRHILSWLASVTDFHDKYIESSGTCVLDYDSLQPLVVDPNLLVHWKNVRDTVINAVRQFPVTSVLDVLEKNGLGDIGFFDDWCSEIPALFTPYRFIRTIQELEDNFSQFGNQFVLGLGNPRNRFLIQNKMLEAGGVLTSVISSSRNRLRNFKSSSVYKSY